MPRKKNGDSISGIFRQYFHAHPHLLDANNNQEIYALFEKDHPNIKLTDSIKGVCANVKSSERKRLGKTKRRRKGGRPKGVTSVRRRKVKAPVTANTAQAANILEDLEETIDGWMNKIREVDPKGSDNVLKYLRRARNLVAVRLDDMDQG